MDTSLLDKAPPNSIEAEQSTLGSMMLEPAALEKGRELLVADDFYRPTHAMVFNALNALAERQEPIDIITVQEELRSRNRLENVGGAEYLIALVESIPTAANIEHYAEIVAEKSKLRQAINGGLEIIAAAKGEEADSKQLADMFMNYAIQLAGSTRDDFIPASDVANETWSMLEDFERGVKPWAIPMPWSNLSDVCNGGLLRNESVLFVADTSQGKSVALMQCALEACKLKIPTLFISCEMKAKEINFRMVCCHARANANELRNGQFPGNTWERLATANAIVHGAPMMFRDKSPTLKGLTSQIHRWVLKQKAEQQTDEINGLVIIDYIGLVDVGDQYENENVASMKAMQATKQWAQNYAIPIVSAAQLRKLPPGLEKPAEVDEEGTLKPRWFGLSDIFGSGEAKKSPDKVIFIYNPNDVPVDFDGKRRAYFKLAKHRNGQAGQTVPMCFFPAQTRFDEIDTRYE